MTICIKQARNFDDVKNLRQINSLQLLSEIVNEIDYDKNKVIIIKPSFELLKSLENVIGKSNVKNFTIIGHSEYSECKKIYYYHEKYYR